MNRHRLQLAIYLSALLLAVGVFLPLTRFPVYGEVSYNRIAAVESWLVIVFALSAPALILSGRKRLSILAPVGVWLVLLFPTLRDWVAAGNNTAVRQLSNGVTAAMRDFSADLFLNITEFHWGGLVLLLALLVFTLAGVVYQFRL